jgi:hypothetical protein
LCHNSQSQQIQEVQAFLLLEQQEKERLQTKMKEQSQTIHQLTHHVKLLHSAQEVATATATLSTKPAFTMRSTAVSLQPQPQSGLSLPVPMSLAHSQTMALPPWDPTVPPGHQLHHKSHHHWSSQPPPQFQPQLPPQPLLQHSVQEERIQKSAMLYPSMVFSQ